MRANNGTKNGTNNEAKELKHQQQWQDILKAVKTTFETTYFQNIFQ